MIKLLERKVDVGNNGSGHYVDKIAGEEDEGKVDVGNIGIMLTLAVSQSRTPWTVRE